MEQDLESWLTKLGLERYTDVFDQGEIDLDAVPTLTSKDLQELGLPVGPKRKVLNAAAELLSDGQPSIEPAHIQSVNVERRHLTILFADLVGSTNLANTYDPEEMRDIDQAYKDETERQVVAFEGNVARFIGDGALCFFGWPQAHEYDAERAVRAGLAISKAITRIKTPNDDVMSVRVGIATGLVVVGDLFSGGLEKDKIAVGIIPALAARIQAVANPGGVLIAPATRRLLGDLFSLEELPPQELKGFSNPIPLWRVIEPRTSHRFEARAGQSLTPLVGRKNEVSMLLGYWRMSRNGQGQVALITGEPGIGKSRLAQTLRERVQREPCFFLRFQCSPFHTNSELYPVIEYLEQAANFSSDDSSDCKLDKLEKLMQKYSQLSDRIIPLLANLLSIPTGTRYLLSEKSPEQNKNETLEVLIAILFELSRTYPVLLLVEDTHWIDPSSRELLNRIVQRIDDLPVLAVLTYRPDFNPSNLGHSNVHLMLLNRLAKRECATMIGQLTKKNLPGGMLVEIVEKSDGIPLFVEELAKTMLESGLLIDGGDHFDLKSGNVPEIAIPDSLQDLLLARLDRLASVKEIAQIGAVIGREFGYQLLVRIVSLPQDKLELALEKLVASGLIYCNGTAPELNYVFKHALVQDAAYQSLFRSKRRELHGQIAEALQTHFSTIVDSRPEILAHHYTEAGLIESSLKYWELAGQRAVGRYAHLEAIGHFKKAIDLIQQASNSKELARTELKIQTSIAGSLAASEGWGSSAAREAYERANTLSKLTGDTRLVSSALSGEWAYQIHAYPRHLVARDLAVAFLEVAESQSDSIGIVMAHRNLAVSQWVLGEHLLAKENLETALRLYNPIKHVDAASVYGLDPRASALSYLARVLWILGYPEKSLMAADEAIAWSHEIKNANTEGLCYLYKIYCQRDLDDVPAVLEGSESLIEFSKQNDLKMWLAKARLFHGWALVRSGQGENGISDIHEGLSSNRRLGTRFLLPYQMSLLVESHIHMGNTDKALELLSEALEHVEEMDDRCWQPELLHLKGQALVSKGAEENVNDALFCFSEAIKIAQSHNARTFELQTAISLAGLWAKLNEKQRAIDLLNPVYKMFTEGFETPNLRRARELIKELS